MELYTAIKTIVDTFGKEIIAERRFLYMLADYYSFRDNPAEKHLIAVLVNDGFLFRLLKVRNKNDIQLVRIQILEDVCKNFGFRRELVSRLLGNILKGLGLKEEERENGNDNSTEKKKKESQIETSKPRYVFSEQYIVNLYSLLLSRKTQISKDDFIEFLNIGYYEADVLLAFLVEIGALLHDEATQLYNVRVPSSIEICKMYRSYIMKAKEQSVTNERKNGAKEQETKVKQDDSLYWKERYSLDYFTSLYYLVLECDKEVFNIKNTSRILKMGLYETSSFLSFLLNAKIIEYDKKKDHYRLIVSSRDEYCDRCLQRYKSLTARRIAYESYK